MGARPHLSCSYAHFILKCARGALGGIKDKAGLIDPAQALYQDIERALLVEYTAMPIEGLEIGIDSLVGNFRHHWHCRLKTMWQSYCPRLKVL